MTKQEEIALGKELAKNEILLRIDVADDFDERYLNVKPDIEDATGEVRGILIQYWSYSGMKSYRTRTGNDKKILDLLERKLEEGQDIDTEPYKYNN